MNVFRKAAAAALFAVTCTPALAGVVYTNGAPSWSSGVNVGVFAVSNSFTLDSTTTLSSVTAGLMTYANAPLVSGITWTIGSSAFGAEHGSAHAGVTNQVVHQSGYVGSLATIALDTTLAAGTYWLTLTHANAGAGNVFWAYGNGTSSAQQRYPGGVASNVGNSYFALSALSAEVPEPASLALLGLGLAGLAAAGRRRPAPRA